MIVPISIFTKAPSQKGENPYSIPFSRPYIVTSRPTPNNNIIIVPRLVNDNIISIPFDLVDSYMYDMIVLLMINPIRKPPLPPVNFSKPNSPLAKMGNPKTPNNTYIKDTKNISLGLYKNARTKIESVCPVIGISPTSIVN